MVWKKRHIYRRTISDTTFQRIYWSFIFFHCVCEMLFIYPKKNKRKMKERKKDRNKKHYKCSLLWIVVAVFFAVLHTVEPFWSTKAWVVNLVALNIWFHCKSTVESASSCQLYSFCGLYFNGFKTRRQCKWKHIQWYRR